MQINFPTQAPEFKVKPVETGGEQEKVQSKAKNTSSEVKPEIEVESENFDKIQNLQKALSEHDLNLKFRQDEETNQLVVELIDSKTGVAIRQMPSEVSLKLSAAFAKLQGQLVDEHI